MHPRDEPHQTSALIDHIYAALFSEAPWQEFLDRSTALLPNGHSVLLFHDKASGDGAFSMAAGLDDGMVQKYNSEYFAINPWTEHALIRPLKRVMQADEMLPRRELLRTQYYDEYLRPQDIVTGLGVTLACQADRHIFFSIVCADTDEEQMRGAKRTLTMLVPHLARTFGARVASAGHLSGALRVDGKLKVVSADRAALALMDGTEILSVGALGQLVCRDADLLQVIQLMLAPAGQATGTPAVHHCHVPRAGGALPLRLCIYRPGPTGSDLAGGQDCFIRLEDPTPALHDGVRRFGAMHHLSAAEISIVKGLVDGLTLDRIAADRRTSPDTVRTQLRNIFAKTGCCRQVDIVRHVAIMAGPGGADVVRPPSGVCGTGREG
ncbi:LuxR C-terminal-related transcriptional regulator [uncultured Paracoccus sp.]|uniref:helix-turn-helix transcriptional regulator n=1 Tax=uncultured Paracoccus sp. TaxID=189685 RepID=UPI002620E7EF|nr:LuxR C-terminal-related transcriptional regulator [uncultured Paracoccus sp.]